MRRRSGVVCGTAISSVCKGGSEVMSERIAEGRLELLPRVGHLPAPEVTDTVTELPADFVARVGSERAAAEAAR